MALLLPRLTGWFATLFKKRRTGGVCILMAGLVLFAMGPSLACAYNLFESPSYDDMQREIDTLKMEIESLKQQSKPPFIMPRETTICGVRIDFSDQFIYRRVKKEINEIIFAEGQLGNLIDLSGEFFPVIEPILAKYNVPDDLKYLVAVESNFKVRAASYAGAKGPWQFINASAKQHGLKYASDYDERYNLELATEAAAKHLIGSYKIFGDWLLAITAYNKGNRGVNNILSIQGIDLSADEEQKNGNGEQLDTPDSGAENLENYMAEQRDSNFWDLVLLVKIQRRGRIVGYRNEQERYVPRVIAMKLILENCYDYDFLKFDRHNKFQPIPKEIVVAPHSMSSLEVAKSLGISLWNLKHINPQYKGIYPVFPKGKEFCLPLGYKITFDEVKNSIKPYKYQTYSKSYSSAKRDPHKSGDSIPDVVTLRKGETLWDISKHFGVPMQKILKLNNITYQSARYLRPGTQIKLK